MPIKINVPFSQKDEVKKLGAVWIPDVKTWSIPDTIEDINPFKPWLPREEGSIVKYPHVIAKSSRKCWKCHEETPLIALGAKKEYLHSYKSATESAWTKYEYPTLFQEIIFLDPEFANALQPRFPFFKETYSKTMKQKSWANTCIHCQALQGDHFNFDEPNAPFCPTSPEEAMQIKTERIPIRFDYYLIAGHSENEAYEWINF